MPHPYARKERTPARDLIAWGLDVPILRNILRNAVVPRLPTFQRLVGWGRPEPRLLKPAEPPITQPRSSDYYRPRVQPADSIPWLRLREESTDAEDAMATAVFSPQDSLIPPTPRSSDRSAAQAHLAELAQAADFERRLTGRRTRLHTVKDWSPARQKLMRIDKDVQHTIKIKRSPKLEFEEAEEADDEGAAAEGEDEVTVERELSQSTELTTDSVERFFEAAWGSTSDSIAQEEDESTDVERDSLDSLFGLPSFLSSGTGSKIFKNLQLKQEVGPILLDDSVVGEELALRAEHPSDDVCTARDCSSCMWKAVGGRPRGLT